MDAKVCEGCGNFHETVELDGGVASRPYVTCDLYMGKDSPGPSEFAAGRRTFFERSFYGTLVVNPKCPRRSDHAVSRRLREL